MPGAQKRDPGCRWPRLQACLISALVRGVRWVPSAGDSHNTQWSLPVWDRPWSLGASGFCCRPAQTLPRFLLQQRASAPRNAPRRKHQHRRMCRLVAWLEHMSGGQSCSAPLKVPTASMKLCCRRQNTGEHPDRLLMQLLASSRPGRHPPAPVSSRPPVPGCSGCRLPLDCAWGKAGPQ